ncbi:hypothetical protein Q3C32_04840 [Enterococcus faecium]|nr:hypothetical protein [Enterococcus faecium]
MVRYESFHGTASDIAKDKIKFDKKNIKLTNYNTEFSTGINYNRTKRGRKAKPPGSLGYGFYSFVYTKELAEKFISKCHSDYTVMKVISNFEEDEILDFEEKDVRDKFHAFRSVFLQHVKIIYEQFGKPSNTHNQHVIDGLVIENFINELARRENKTISSVLMWTFTPCGETEEDRKLVSYVPNGLELCIRNKDKIDLLEEECL